ncbi:unnamed protein product [Pedinophyceae sp. YPF-701]|nr:unnamed protein product [Pedinophyceae sp. YPF-701]
MLRLRRAKLLGTALGPCSGPATCHGVSRWLSDKTGGSFNLSGFLGDALKDSDSLLKSKVDRGSGPSGAPRRRDGLWDVVVVGAGPAAYTAALYSARNARRTLVLQGDGPAGQLSTTKEVENYPGFPQGVLGPELVERCHEQARVCGAESENSWVRKVDLAPDGAAERFLLTVDAVGGSQQLATRALIVATGADARRLGCPGEDEYWTKGVSACAVCDGALPMFRNKTVVVVGGGDSAMEESLHLTKYASKVLVVHRRDKLRASKVLQERVLRHPKVEVAWSSRVRRIVGSGGVVGGVELEATAEGGAEGTVEVAGVFMAIGHTPNTGFLKESGPPFSGVVDDASGLLRVTAGCTETGVAGLFAAGDVADGRYRQAVTAAGTGCMAALDADHYLQQTDS